MYLYAFIPGRVSEGWNSYDEYLYIPNTVIALVNQKINLKKNPQRKERILPRHKPVVQRQDHRVREIRKKTLESYVDTEGRRHNKLHNATIKSIPSGSVTNVK
ncbi:hypothetical protein BDQ17DRAFT_1328941 [Cyathus striatus]|nr:hypothetical protein BDQ17DRAFT_1328941 [Cyathus striatus]